MKSTRVYSRSWVVIIIIGIMVAITPGYLNQPDLSSTETNAASGEVRSDQPARFQTTAMDKKYTDTEASNLKKVKDSFDAWSNGTGSPYQLLRDDVSWTIVGNSLASKEYKSRKAFIDEVITPFNARMSKPLSPTIRGIYADGDMVVVLFDAEGTAKDGKTYANTYSWFLRMKEGEIENSVAFFDSIRFNDLWTLVRAAK